MRRSLKLGDGGRQRPGTRGSTGSLAEATDPFQVNLCPPCVSNTLFLGTGPGSHPGAESQVAAGGESQGALGDLLPAPHPLPVLLDSEAAKGNLQPPRPGQPEWTRQPGPSSDTGSDWPR